MQLRVLDSPEPQEMLPALLTIKQVAEACQVSARTVRRAIAAGALAACQLGSRGTWRIRPEAVVQWLDSCSREQPEPSDSITVQAGSVVEFSSPTGRSRSSGRLTVTDGMGRKR